VKRRGRKGYPPLAFLRELGFLKEKKLTPEGVKNFGEKRLEFRGKEKKEQKVFN